MPTDHRFYSMPLSHYCVAVDRMLAFKGLDTAVVRVPYHDKTELIRATGQDYVPALVWDDRIVTWQEIPRFLDSVRPTPSLYPPGTEGVAPVLQHWAHQVLEERVWRAVVTEVPRTLPDERERWVFEEMQTRARGPWHVLEARRDEFTRDAVETMGMVDTMLKDRAWVLGEPSVADFGLFGALSPWQLVGRPFPRELSHMGRWVEKIRSLGAPPGSGAAGPKARRR